MQCNVAWCQVKSRGGFWMARLCSLGHMINLKLRPGQLEALGARDRASSKPRSRPAGPGVCTRVAVESGSRKSAAISRATLRSRPGLPSSDARATPRDRTGPRACSDAAKGVQQVLRLNRKFPRLKGSFLRLEKSCRCFAYSHDFKIRRDINHLWDHGNFECQLFSSSESSPEP